MNGQPRTREQLMAACLETVLMAFGQYAAMNFLGPAWYYSDEEQRDALPASEPISNDTHHTGTAS